MKKALSYLYQVLLYGSLVATLFYPSIVQLHNLAYGLYWVQVAFTTFGTVAMVAVMAMMIFGDIVSDGNARSKARASFTKGTAYADALKAREKRPTALPKTVFFCLVFVVLGFLNGFVFLAVTIAILDMILLLVSYAIQESVIKFAEKGSLTAD